jgi:hypothetical protein
MQKEPAAQLYVDMRATRALADESSPPARVRPPLLLVGVTAAHMSAATHTVEETAVESSQTGSTSLAPGHTAEFFGRPHAFRSPRRSRVRAVGGAKVIAAECNVKTLRATHHAAIDGDEPATLTPARTERHLGSLAMAGRDVLVVVACASPHLPALSC